MTLFHCLNISLIQCRCSWYCCHKKHKFVCGGLLTCPVLFEQTGVESREQTESIYNACSVWAEGFTFGLSTSQHHGDRVMTTRMLHSTSPCSAKLLVSSAWWSSAFPCYGRFLWGRHGGVQTLRLRSSPPAMLAFVPAYGSFNPSVLASHWATSLRLSDLAVCREGFSHSNWFTELPITLLLWCLIGLVL